MDRNGYAFEGCVMDIIYDFDHIIPEDEVTLEQAVDIIGEKAVKAIAVHVNHARKTHPSFMTSMIEACADVMREEMEEVQDAVCDMEDNIFNYLTEEETRELEEHIDYELYDLIAVCVRMLNGDYL